MADTQTDTHTHTHTHKQTHTQTHRHTHTDRHTQTQTHRHTDTHTQTHTHRHTHTMQVAGAVLETTNRSAALIRGEGHGALHLHRHWRSGTTANHPALIPLHCNPHSRTDWAALLVQTDKTGMDPAYDCIMRTYRFSRKDLASYLQVRACLVADGMQLIIAMLCRSLLRVHPRRCRITDSAQGHPRP